MSTHANKDHYVEIPLTFDPDHFWEIYNEQWKDEITLIDRHHLQRIYLGRILVALIVFGFMMLFIQWLWSLFAGLGIFFSVMHQLRLAGELQLMEKKLDTKREDVEKWLAELKHAKNFRLLLTPDHFTFFQDETPHQMLWKNCTSYATNKHYVMIVGQEEESNFIFPRKSMNDSDFFVLTNTVEEKI